MKNQEIVIFNGTEYRLMGSKKYYLSQSRSNEGRRKAKGLHVAIWEFYNKRTVPHGYHVHHKDEDVFNNDISNLELIKKRKHLSEHSKKWHLENKEKSNQMLDNIRDKAKEWHKSEEGRKWHSIHGKEAWESRSVYKNICSFCGKEFETKIYTTKYCSQNCRTKASFERTKVEYKGNCVVCGVEFTATQLTKSKPKRKTCSTKCRNNLVHINRRINQ